MRGRLAEVVLGCSGHYIDPRSVGYRARLLIIIGGGCSNSTSDLASLERIG